MPRESNGRHPAYHVGTFCTAGTSSKTLTNPEHSIKSFACYLYAQQGALGKPSLLIDELRINRLLRVVGGSSGSFLTVCGPGFGVVVWGRRLVQRDKDRAGGV
jgi:hypothetical protein